MTYLLLILLILLSCKTLCYSWKLTNSRNSICSITQTIVESSLTNLRIVRNVTINHTCTISRRSIHWHPHVSRAIYSWKNWKRWSTNLRYEWVRNSRVEFSFVSQKRIQNLHNLRRKILSILFTYSKLNDWYLNE